MNIPQTYLDLYLEHYKNRLFQNEWDFQEVNNSISAILSPFKAALPKNKKALIQNKYLYFGKYKEGENLVEKIKHYFFLYRTLCIYNDIERYPEPEITEYYPDSFFYLETVEKWYKEIVLRYLHLIDTIDEFSLIEEKANDEFILNYAEILDDGHQMEFLAEFVELVYALEGYVISIENLYIKPEDRNANLNYYLIYLKSLNIDFSNLILPSLSPLNSVNQNGEINDRSASNNEDNGTIGFKEETEKIEKTGKLLNLGFADSSSKQIRVFISSTFSDMQRERDELVNTFNMLRKEAEKRGISVTMVDLRWGITEEESARGEVLDICLKEIEKSKPFFVGILGDNYGSRPPLELIYNNELTILYPWITEDIQNQLSYTEIEMQSAVLRNPQLINAYFYIKETPEKKATNDAERRLLHLKEEVMTQSRYPYYAYNHPSQISNQIIKDFREIIDEMCPKEEVITFRQTIEQQQKNRLSNLLNFYIHRKEFEQHIDEFLKSLNKKILVIEGDHGEGKSSLAAYCIQQYIDEFDIKYYFTDQNNGNLKLLETASYFLNENISFEKILAAVEHSIKNNEKPILIVIDDGDRIDYSHYENTLRFWLEKLPSTIKIIVTSHHGWEFANWLKTQDFSSSFSLAELSSQQRLEFAEKYLSLRGKKLTEAQIKKLMKSTLLNNPSNLKGVLDELSAFGHYDTLELQIELYSFLKEKTNLYLPIFTKLEDNFGKKAIKKVSQYIYLSFQGLTENDLKELTGLRQLDISLILGSGEAIYKFQGNRVLFVNSEVRKLAYDRYFTSFEEEKNVRLKFISRLEKKCDDFNLFFSDYDPFRKDFSVSETTGYIHELGYQLFQLEDLPGLSDYILNLYFIEVLFRLNRSLLNDIWLFLKNSHFDFSQIPHQLSKFDYDAYLIPVILNDIMCVAIDNENPEIGIQCSEAALESLSKFQGANIDMTRAGILNNTAILYAETNNLEKSLELFNRSKDLTMDLFPHYSPEVAKAFKNLGLIYSKLKRYDKSLESYQEVLNIYNNLYGSENNIQSAEIMYEMIDCLFYLDKDDECNVLAKKVSEIYFKIQGENSPRGWICLIFIGRTYFYANKFQKAIEILNEYSEEVLKRFGKGHYVTEYAFRFLGKAWEETSKLMKDKVSPLRYREMIEYTAYAFSYSDSQEKAYRYLKLLQSL